MSSWILVANRVGARLFVRQGKDVELIRTIDHPDGRKRDQDIEAHQSTRSFDAHGRGRSAPDSKTSPHEQAAARFARDLGDMLSRGRTQQGVSRITLVAEPHFLGLLRGALDAPTAAIVTGSVTKDLGPMPDNELTAHLQSL